MPASKCFSPVHIKPVTGYLDVRSNPDDVPFGGYRWAQNVEVTQKYKMCRMRGHRKFQDGDTYNNQDLHDQLTTKFLSNRVRQPIQFLQEVISPAGFSHLFAGTQSRLYVKVGATGNWKIVSDLLGGGYVQGCSDKIRWTMGGVGQTVVVSNGLDAPAYHILGQPEDFHGQSLAPIRDLVSLKITQVGIVVSWNDLIILFNVVQDGQRIADRIVWSDHEHPLSYKEDVGVSLAGSYNLGIGESILGVAPLNNTLIVYTTMGIWQINAVGGESVLSFTKLYAPHKVGSRCLAYPNTLVSNGDSNFYFARDGIYEFNRYYPTPQLVDWIHKASSVVFDTIDPARCNVHQGAYHSDRRQIWWSWCNRGEDCPSQSLIINLEFPFSSYVDHGYTAFCNHAPDTNKTIREFLIENCICTPEEMTAMGGGFEKEGEYCEAPVAPVCTTRPKSWWTSTARVEDDVEVEDWTKGSPDTDSFAYLFGGKTFLNLCGEEWKEDECNAALLFVMASSTDYCLKEYADVYYRERYSGTTTCPNSNALKGVYIKEGYRTLLRSGPIDLKIPDDDKVVSRFAIDCHPDESAIPAQLNLRIGISGQPLDPNINNAGRRVILWETQDPKVLDYMGDATEAQHREQATRPANEMEWALYLITRWIYFEIEITNPNVSPSDTGGGVCFSRFTFDAKAEPRCI